MVRMFLDLSTTHLKASTRAMWSLATGPAELPFSGGPTDYGWFAHAPESNDDHLFTDDLWACMQRARALGCDYILFDADAGIDDALPIYGDGNTPLVLPRDAAPDMLAALKRLEDEGLLQALFDLDSSREDGEEPIAAKAVEQARAAIARAEGR